LSGIVGMFARDGAPADEAQLKELVRFLRYRAPDASEVWAEGNVGLGHSMLRTTRDATNERQPASLDGQIWITADARIDCRVELGSKLSAAGCKFRQDAPDSEFILHAYATWRENCVQHLRGDFAFAIWDAARRTLLCARDHFGVKPFYYATIGDLFLFSNTLNCVRQHPTVSDELNESAIADFLLFGLNCDAATTTYRDVQRLPPAHTLSVSPESVRLQRYWSAPTDGRIRYANENEYVEHFQSVLKSAVSDRLRADRVGIFLSGGLDSSSVAAMARELSSTPDGAPDLRAYTIVYDKLIADRDGEHARLAADFFRIPIRQMAVDDLPLFDRWDDTELAWPEPVDDPFFAGLFDQFRMIAEDCRVVLSGEGSDNLMYFEMWPYAEDLVCRKEWGQLVNDLPSYLANRKSPWPGIRRRAENLFREDPNALTLPSWIAPDFARRTNAEARWKEQTQFSADERHPLLPSGHRSLALPHWAHLFENENPGVTRQPVEVRHPFMDLRVVEFLLALPPYPWFFEKKLLRDAMVGRIPEIIRSRPKTPLAGTPLVEMLGRPQAKWVDQVKWGEEVTRFVSPSAIGSLVKERRAGKAYVNIRPLCLSLWLQSVQRVRYNWNAEVRHG
jgi:asparagine synthase (glutamine-hydrolysing)